MHKYGRSLWRNCDSAELQMEPYDVESLAHHPLYPSSTGQEIQRTKGTHTCENTLAHKTHSPAGPEAAPKAWVGSSQTSFSAGGAHCCCLSLRHEWWPRGSCVWEGELGYILVFMCEVSLRAQCWVEKWGVIWMKPAPGSLHTILLQG